MKSLTIKDQITSSTVDENFTHTNEVVSDDLFQATDPPPISIVSPRKRSSTLDDDVVTLRSPRKRSMSMNEI